MDYLGHGIQALRELLDEHLAAPWREVEARLADNRWPSVPVPVQPHILSDARRFLTAEGDLVPVTHATLGGREVNLVTTGKTHRRQTAINAAVRTKSVLYGRYLSWAEGPLSNDHPSGVIGKAGERVLANAIRSGLTGIAPLAEPGDVATLLELRLRGGSYDDAAALFAVLDGKAETIVLPFEMKNVRRWIYPDDQELHKFLYRSAYLQQERPDAVVCPVIVCRRRNAKTWKMAKDLGFYAIQTGLQYVLDTARIDRDAFDEVRRGLLFMDLTQERESPRLRKAIDKSLRRDAAVTAARWKSHGSQLLEHYDQLRKSLSDSARLDAVTGLQREALDMPDAHDPWLIDDVHAFQYGLEE